jgi:formylglycine-generating enzyme required for sulfatase activity
MSALTDFAVPLDLSATPQGMVYVPGGTFMMGALYWSAQPIHQQTVAAFYLDITEVTVGSYQQCVNEGNCADLSPTFNCNWKVAGKENHPINCVDWNQADNYCRKNQKRLPTEIEFEYVMRGPQGSTYSWGAANPISPPDPNAQLWWNRTISTGTSPVGAFPKTLLGELSANGISDIAGNVIEWTSHAQCQYPLTQNGGQACDSSKRMYRGGSFFYDKIDYFWGYYRETFAALAYTDPTLGFRCAKSIN